MNKIVSETQIFEFRIWKLSLCILSKAEADIGDGAQIVQIQVLEHFNHAVVVQMQYSCRTHWRSWWLHFTHSGRWSKSLDGDGAEMLSTCFEYEMKSIAKISAYHSNWTECILPQSSSVDESMSTRSDLFCLSVTNDFRNENERRLSETKIGVVAIRTENCAST